MDVTVVVAGNPQVVEMGDGASVFELMNRSIRQAAYDPIVPEDWEMRDPEGALLRYADRIPSSQRLFLNRKAGIGG